MNDHFISFTGITVQYVDYLNIKYLNMNQEKRLKNLPVLAKRIAFFQSDPDHLEIKDVITEGAQEQGCSESDLGLEGIEYPEEIVW